jgi:hypothetical protein
MSLPLNKLTRLTFVVVTGFKKLYICDEQILIAYIQ